MRRRTFLYWPESRAIKWYLVDASNTGVELTIAFLLVEWGRMHFGLSGVVVGAAFAIAAAAVAITGPLWGSAADRSGKYGILLGVTTLVSGGMTISLGLFGPKQVGAFLAAGVLASYFFGVSVLVYNSVMTRMTRGSAVEVSGIGTGVSYLAAGLMVALGTLVFRDRAAGMMFIGAGGVYVLGSTPAVLALRRSRRDLSEPVEVAAAPKRWEPSHRMKVLFVSYGAFNASLAGFALFLKGALPVIGIPAGRETAVWLVCVFLAGIGAVGGGIITSRSHRGLRTIAVGGAGWVLSLFAIAGGGMSAGWIGLVPAALTGGMLVGVMRGLFAVSSAEDEQGTTFGWFALVQRGSAGIGVGAWSAVLAMAGHDEVQWGMGMLGALGALGAIALTRIESHERKP